jgi:hypothetical protein
MINKPRGASAGTSAAPSSPLPPASAGGSAGSAAGPLRAPGSAGPAAPMPPASRDRTVALEQFKQHNPDVAVRQGVGAAAAQNH